MPKSSQISSAWSLIPKSPTLEALREAAAGCRACDLWGRGTQTVFGEGARGAEVMLVGEQPGDKEDVSGRPFVGPAGRVLDDGLEAAGIDRSEVYITNVVKHFKWEERGKRRIHKKPNVAEITACRPWLEAEIEVTRPRVVVCLGSTAAQALLGKDFRVTRQHGQFIDWASAPTGVAGRPEASDREDHPVPDITATVHPSSILRAPDEDARAAAMTGFIADLSAVAARLQGTG